MERTPKRHEVEAILLKHVPITYGIVNVHKSYIIDAMIEYGQILLSQQDLFTEEQRTNLLCSALEGGSNYWYYLPESADDIIQKYKEEGDTYVDRMWKAILAGESIPVHDAEDEDELLGSISLQSIREGEALMKTQAASHFADVMAENDDATTGDVWFQYATMKEIVYG